jgi:hypothetical protein
VSVSVSKHQNIGIKIKMKALGSGTLRFMNIGTLPSVKISLDYWAFGLGLSSDIPNGTPTFRQTSDWHYSQTE